MISTENTPFFILGCVRSGTTLLRDVLKNHPRLACPEETHFFRWADPFGTDRYRRMYENSEILQRQQAMDGMDPAAFSGLMKDAPNRKALMEAYAEWFLEKSGRSGGRFFDKTPQHVYGILLLHAAFPDARFVHIHRNPLNVVTSLMAGKVMPPHSLKGAVNYWLESMMLIDAFRKIRPGLIFEIPYEKFTVTPKKIIEDLLTFIGENPEISFPEDRIHPEKNKYKDALTRKEAEEVIAACEPFYSGYGYSDTILPDFPKDEPSQSKPIIPASGGRETPTLILVLGMHRSGTSAAARLLNLYGTALGRDLIAPMNGVNDAGFWEHREINLIHEEIFAALGSAWFDTRFLPDDWTDKDEIKPMGERIKEVIIRETSSVSLFGVKDPRLCRLLPLWRRVLDNENILIKCLLVIRHPLEASRSMEKRDGFPVECGMDLWMHHVLASEISSRDLPRSLVFYEDILSDPAGIMEKTGSDMDIFWPDSPGLEEIGKEINPDFRHHVSDGRDMNFPHPAFALYDLCRKGLSGETIPEWDKIRREFTPAGAQVIFESHCRMTGQSRKLTSLGEEHREALSVIREKDDELSKINAKLEKLGREHAYALSVIRERDDELSKINAKLEKLGKEHAHALSVIKERDDQLAELWEKHHALGKELETLHAGRLYRIGMLFSKRKP